MNNDFTYCKGEGGKKRDTCRRYTEGKNLPEGNWWWMSYCNPSDRWGYIENKRATQV